MGHSLQHLGCAPPDSGSAPAATRCSSKHSLSVPLLGWQHPGWECVATARSHRKLALAEGALPAREMGPATLGRHRAPGDTSLQAVPGDGGGVTPRVPDFCSPARGSATAFPLPTPSCSICRRYFPSVAIWAVTFPIPLSIFCASVHLLGFWVIHVIWEILNVWGNSYEEMPVMGGSREMGVCRTGNSDSLSAKAKPAHRSEPPEGCVRTCQSSECVWLCGSGSDPAPL